MKKPGRLPWNEICEEVTRAAKKLGSPRFINVMDISNHMASKVSEYPAISQRSEWHPNEPVTDRSITVRVNEAIDMMGWKPWNNGKARSTGRVYLLPWVPEDPVVVSIREGRAVKI